MKRLCDFAGYPGNVDLKLLYAIFRQADSMQSLTLTLTLAYNNSRSTFPGLPLCRIPQLRIITPHRTE